MNTYYVGSIPVSDELYHHGILGQKWGKRNGPPYPLDANDHSKAEQKAGWRKSLDKDERNKGNNDSSGDKVRNKGLTEKQKKIIKRVLLATAAVGVGTAMVYATKKADFIDGYTLRSIYKTPMVNSGPDFYQVDDNDLIFEKGFEFHRISSRENEDYSNAERIYAAFKPDDIDRYKAILPDFFKQWRKKGRLDIDPSKVYDIALKANSEIRSPSAKKRVEAFVELFKDDDFRSKLSKSFNMTPQDFENHVMSLGGNNRAARSLYEQFAAALAGTGDYGAAPKMYFDKIKEMGYNAIVDDNDSGKLSKTPMILLDPKNNFVVAGSRQVKSLERFTAVMRLKNFDFWDSDVGKR